MYVSIMKMLCEECTVGNNALNTSIHISSPPPLPPYSFDPKNTNLYFACTITTIMKSSSF